MTEANVPRTLVIEKELPHAPGKVWRALTQPALIAEWLMQNDFQPIVGHKFNFRTAPMASWDGVIHSEVLIVEPNKKLSFRWNSLGLETVVVLTVIATPEGTLLRMEQSGFRTDQEANYQGAKYGWRKFLGNLERVFETLQ